MSSAEYHQLADEPLEKVLSSLVEQRGSAVVKVETPHGHAALSIAEGTLRGAVFGEYQGTDAVRRVLDEREGVYQIHLMTPPPPAGPSQFKKTLFQAGGPQGASKEPAHDNSLKSLLQSREHSRSNGHQAEQPVLVRQRRVLSENPPAHSKTTEDKNPAEIQAPVQPLVATPRALGEKDTSLNRTSAPPSANLASSRTDSSASRTQSLRLQFNQTHFSGTSPKVALAPSAAPAIQDDVPVPSSRFAQHTLSELEELDSAIQISRPSHEIPSAPEGIPSHTLRSTPKRDTAGLPRVGRYEILARLKKGGMGSVYLCRMSGNAGFRRLFAMKVLNIEQEQRTDALDELFREARVLAQMHHPNIVGIVDVGTPTEPYLVLDYVEGGSLHELCQASPHQRDPAKIVSIFLDALAGIAAAHRATDENGHPLMVVHCDITPHNLLVGVDGACRVADFGIAHTHGAKDGAILLGKPGYVAPERLLRQASDQRADLFSLGVVLYTALTGVEPFAADTAEEILRATIEREVIPPSQVGLCPPPSLDWICMKALARDPNVRFQSAEDMIIRLRKLAAKEELLATPSEVAAWVQSALGQQIEATRRSARRNTPGSGMSEAPPPPEALFAPMPASISTPPDSQGSQQKTEALSFPTSPLPDATSTSETQIPGVPPERNVEKFKTIGVAALILLLLLGLLFFPGKIRNVFDAPSKDPPASPSTVGTPSAPKTERTDPAGSPQEPLPEANEDGVVIPRIEPASR